MSQNNSHIDLERLRDYFEGNMSQEERHALEMEAQNDPFLSEAMDGYSEFPDGIDRVSQLQSSSGASWGKIIISFMTVAAVAVIIALIVNPDIQDLETEELVEVPVYQEVEIVPEYMDSFVVVEEIEQITPIEIVQNENLREQSEKGKEVQLADSVFVDPIDYDDIDHVVEPENGHQGMTVYAPSIYQYDLYVVDYREIEREKENVNYTRYEFTGLSAEFENDLARENKDLVETNVEVPYMEYLEKSMYYFSKGQFKKALNRYLTILEQYPEDLNAHFYGALCYYDMKQYSKSVEFFELILANEEEAGFVAFRQEAKWYMTKSLIKLGKKSQAKVILEEIIAEGLFYAEDAIQLKASL